MTDNARTWRIGLILTASAWLITTAVAIISIARFELNRASGLGAVSFWLALLAGVVSVITAGFALRGLRRQQHIERELRRSQTTFEGILTISADAIIHIDNQQRITMFNHGAEKTFGYQGSEVLGKSLDLLIPQRFHRAHESHIDRFGRDRDVARRMGERRPIFGVRKDGREFPAEASIARLDVDGTRLFSVVLRDITERLQAEDRQRFLARAGAELAASLETEQTLVAASHCGVPYLADCALLDIIEPSGGVRRLASVHDDPEATRVLRRFEGHTAHPPHWPFPVAEVMASGVPVIRRALASGWSRAGADAADRLADVESLGVRAFITVPLSVRDRAFGAITFIATDPARDCGDDQCAIALALAERVAVAIDNASHYREARRASQARDELLGIVSHDLRNPLSAISMCARVLAERPPEDHAEQHELAAAILDSVALMQRLIQDLLDVATIESGHLRIVPELSDPREVARRALAMVQEQADERGIEVRAALPHALRPVRMDAMRIEQVIANLLANGVKFTDRGGRVSLDLALESAALRVTVSDTGIGIPADALPHIFDRFWHSRRSGRTVGTGLGLAIARGIVVAHGGTLEVVSSVGEGSRFSFLLPDEEPRGAPAPDLFDSATAAAGRRDP